MSPQDRAAECEQAGPPYRPRRLPQRSSRWAARLGNRPQTCTTRLPRGIRLARRSRLDSGGNNAHCFALDPEGQEGSVTFTTKSRTASCSAEGVAPKTTAFPNPTRTCIRGRARSASSTSLRAPQARDRGPRRPPGLPRRPPLPHGAGRPRRAWLSSLRPGRRPTGLPSRQPALRVDLGHRHHRSRLRRMARHLERPGDDYRAPRPAHPPLPHRRHRQRELALQELRPTQPSPCARSGTQPLSITAPLRRAASCSSPDRANSTPKGEDCVPADNLTTGGVVLGVREWLAGKLRTDFTRAGLTARLDSGGQ